MCKFLLNMECFCPLKSEYKVIKLLEARFSCFLCKHQRGLFPPLAWQVPGPAARPAGQGAETRDHCSVHVGGNRPRMEECGTRAATRTIPGSQDREVGMMLSPGRPHGEMDVVSGPLTPCCRPSVASYSPLHARKQAASMVQNLDRIVLAVDDNRA